MRSGREAVTRGSFWRSEPAAALRGLANGALPASTRPALSSRNATTGKKTSPRTSNRRGAPLSATCRDDGTFAMVRTFSVTSSPVTPLPRVSARTSRPSS